MNTSTIKTIPLVLLVLLIFITSSAHAQQNPAAVTFVASSNSIAVEEQVAVDVLLRADTPVNALDLQIAYSPKTLEFKQIRDGSSIVDIWGEKKLADTGIFRIRGGMLRAFEGEAGKIVQLIFTAKAEGQGQISLREGEVFKADGRGTPLSLSSSFISLEIKNADGNITGVEQSKQTLFLEDNTPPTLTSKIVPGALGETLLLIASAHDRESGVSEMQVRTKKWFSWGAWQTYQSPQRIPNNVWAAELRAANFDGKVITNTLYRPRVAMLRFGVIALTILAALTAFIAFYTRRELPA